MRRIIGAAFNDARLMRLVAAGTQPEAAPLGSAAERRAAGRGPARHFPPLHRPLLTARTARNPARGVLQNAGIPAAQTRRGNVHARLLRSGCRSQPDQGQQGRDRRLWQPGPRPCAQPPRFRRQGRGHRAEARLGDGQEGGGRRPAGEVGGRGRQLGRPHHDVRARTSCRPTSGTTTSPPTSATARPSPSPTGSTSTST